MRVFLLRVPPGALSALVLWVVGALIPRAVLNTALCLSLLQACLRIPQDMNPLHIVEVRNGSARHSVGRALSPASSPTMLTPSLPITSSPFA